MKNDFESDLVRSLNFHLKDEGISYRLKQSEFAEQVTDVLLDSLSYGYCFIECKSIDYKKYDRIYFSNRFSDGQIEGIEDFRKKSGRIGFLAVETRNGIGHKNEVYIYDWKKIYENYINGEKAILPKDSDFRVMKIGEYHDFGRFFGLLLKRLDVTPK